MPQSLTSTNAIAFISPDVSDYQSLMAGVTPGTEVVLLDPKLDAIAQITDTLARFHNIVTIHIISHGAPGCLYFGNTQLSLDTLERYAWDLQSWFSSSSPLPTSSSLLLYGCNVAAGDAGEEFIQKLHQLTGAEIAASANRTGSALQGGDWELEVITGTVNKSLAFLPQVMETYTGVFVELSTASGDGGVTVTVDALGKSSNAFYEPVGSQSSSDTIYLSDVAIRFGDTGSRSFLSSGATDVILTNTSSTSAQSTFTYNGLNFVLNQSVSDLFNTSNSRTGSQLIQRYTITNPGVTAVNIELIRYLDGDLQFDGSIADRGGRLVSSNGQDILFETDSSDDPSAPTTFVGITANGGTVLSGGYEIDSYDGLENRIIQGLALDNTITGDGDDADQFIDSDYNAYDVTLALGRGFVINAGTSVTYTTTTAFGTGSPTQLLEEIIADINNPPTVANAIAGQLSNQNFNQNQAFSFQFASNTFVDVDGGSFTYTATRVDGSSLPSWLNFNGATRTFSGTPSNQNVGTIGIKVIATDASNESAIDTFDLEVTGNNNLPTVANAIANQTINKNQAFNFQFVSETFSDVDGGSLTYTATRADGTALPSWLNFNAATRTFSGTPTSQEVGTISLKVTATDSSNGTISDTFDLEITGNNNLPTVANAIANQTINKNQAFNFQFVSETFSDVDGGSLTYTATRADGTALPSWLNFNAATRTFSGTPTSQEVGTINIKVTATDSSNGTISDTFDLEVTGNNNPPTVANAIADTSVEHETLFNFIIPANIFNDLDADTLTYTAKLANGNPLPSWLSFNATTRTFSGTPGHSDVGPLSITVEAIDSAGGNATDTFDLTVTDNGHEEPCVGPDGATLGDDVICGTPNPDQIDGLPGNDIIKGKGGDDEIFGGQGNDTLYGEDGADLLDGGAGIDLLKGGAGNDQIYGGIGNDTLHGEDGADLLDGGVGTDLIRGGIGNDRLYGSAGNDTMYGEDGDDIVHGDAGTDQLFGGSGADNLEGGSANDRLSGGLGNDRLEGGTGSDALQGEEGSDFLNGGTGDDLLNGGDGDDRLNGGTDNDRLYGGLGNDMLVGNLERDLLIGWGGGSKEIDTLLGGEDRDTFVLGDTNSAFYTRSGRSDYALIRDFEAGDRIRLHGDASDYSLGSVPNSLNTSGVGIFSDNDLIAVLQGGALNVNTNIATSSVFTFV